jgi:hypothetical protein
LHAITADSFNNVTGGRRYRPPKPLKTGFALFLAEIQVEMDRSVQPIRLLKPICASAALGWMLFSGGTASFGIESATLQQVTIPCYAQGKSSPAAVVHIKTLFTDYQRRGFFRIGLLPLLVAEDVRIEVLQPEETATALQGAKKWLNPGTARKALEWRRVQFIFPNETTPRLEAGRVQLSEDGTWRLTDGVVFRAGTNETRQAEAILQVTGTQAGELRPTHSQAACLNLLQNFTDKSTSK